jgi:hypothetical protein
VSIGTRSKSFLTGVGIEKKSLIPLDPCAAVFAADCRTPSFPSRDAFGGIVERSRGAFRYSMRCRGTTDNQPAVFGIS